MGGTIQSFKDQWSNALSIKNNPTGFVSGTQRLFDAHGKRIQRENENLYKLVDSI